MRVRFRIAHTRTQKLGWQHETTIELDGELDYLANTVEGFSIPELLLDLSREADEAGVRESKRRNARDAESDE